MSVFLFKAHRDNMTYVPLGTNSPTIFVSLIASRMVRVVGAMNRRTSEQTAAR